MDEGKYDRELTLLCPTCGCDQFTFDDADEDGVVICSDCGRETTRDALIADNSENIESQVAEIGEQLTEDVAKELNRSLRDAFKGNKHIRFK